MRQTAIVLSLLITVHSVHAGTNSPPALPTITEPNMPGLILNPQDVHMETAPFSDPDIGDTHSCTDWEIWSVTPSERVWFGSCVTGPEAVHAHFGDGTFMGSLAGEFQLSYETDYLLRVRHRDSSGDAATEWSPYAERMFSTGPQTQTFPLELDDIIDSPAPTWRTTGGVDVSLPDGASMRIESKDSQLLLAFTGAGGMTTITNTAPLAEHLATRLRLSANGASVALPATNITFVTDEGVAVTVYVPAIAVSGAQESIYWISSGGSTFVGNAGQTEPDFSTLARGSPVPWTTSIPGYQVDVVATGLRLPVNIAFVPNATMGGPEAPLYYVTELYGSIKVVSNLGNVSTYASNLLNFSPTGAFPGSGEQGLSGIVVDPATGDVYAGMLYDGGSAHYPKVVRFTSNDGGFTAATQTTILNMPGESQGQSHFISNMTLGPDGKLYVHMGDGFDAATAQNNNSFRGKILRMNLDGSPVTDNPMYDAGDGISSRDYIYASGVRNPFGGTWRASDGRHYWVENGPSVDRITHLVAGRNYLWSGSDASMMNFAAYVWAPSVGPVNMAFIQPETFGGSGFPAEMMDVAFVTESGATWGSGPQVIGKKISMWTFDSNGDLAGGPTTFLQYNGTGKATVAGLAAGPDGLYFTDLYKDQDYNSPIDAGANVLRIKFVGSADFTSDVTEGNAPLTVQFTDTSSVPNPTAWLWNFGDNSTSTEQNPQHTYTSNGAFTVRLQVTSAAGVSTIQKAAHIFVGDRVPIAFLGGGVSPSASDAAIIADLSALGYDVTFYNDAPANRPSAAALASSQDLVIVSSTATSGNIAGEFRDEPVPLIYWESALNATDREPLASARAVIGATQINVLDNAHPVTAGISLGTVDAYTSTTSMSVGQGTLGQDVQVLATRAGAAGDYAIMVADEGGVLLGGHIAPAKRVFLFLEDTGWLTATAETKQIFEQAVLWTAGAVQAAPTIMIDSPTNGQVVIDNSVTVSWTASGDLSGAHHVHLQLDSEPIVMNPNFTGMYTFENVTPGPHTITAWLVAPGHIPLPNDEATTTVNFVVEELIVDPNSISIPLAYNWNALIHNTEGTDPDAPDGYRSISDRGLIMSTADSVGTGGMALTSAGLTYRFVQSPSPALDAVVLGLRRPNGGTAWDNTDDDDNLGVVPTWDPTGGSGQVTSSVTTFAASEPLDETFDIGFLYQISNGGGTFDVTLGFDDASSVTVTLGAPDWFADFGPAMPAAGPGVAVQAYLPGPLSGGIGFLAAGNVDAPIIDGPLSVTEARVTTDSLLADLGFDVSGRRLNSLTFNNFNGGAIAMTGIIAASYSSPSCACVGDLTGDATVNGDDIRRFVDCLVGTGSDCGCADVDGMDGVGQNDIASFVGLLLTGAGCP
ncbi:MAG: PQQ-dependent sugar dehydrogenase [Phycisphaerales bacterium]|nr:PQQ-dependent sugar dehydrogenase [Phycisphaerales bacterium]MCB9857211.1 PQQ-dependent sugar dehydrogenase [Phycisphaerales bacterium]MCB9863076.1 PQQ-dependent sugar dehydrogenase [Phycisphaerales bacterium]